MLLCHQNCIAERQTWLSDVVFFETQADIGLIQEVFWKKETTILQYNEDF
jgi:hypothetical protein